MHTTQAIAKEKARWYFELLSEILDDKLIELIGIDAVHQAVTSHRKITKEKNAVLGKYAADCSDEHRADVLEVYRGSRNNLYTLVHYALGLSAELPAE
jgi:hypothetical protein